MYNKIFRGSENFELTEKKKAIAVGPKESIILHVFTDLSDINVNKEDEVPEYSIEILYDKTIVLDIYERKWVFNLPIKM